MTETEQKVLEIIQKSQKILTFAHIRADWDAIASVLMTTTLLKNQFPTKEIHGAIEKGDINNGSYLPHFSSLLTDDALQTIEAIKPDLIIIVDCPEITRISFNSDELINFINTTSIPIIGIDHHELSTIYPPSIVINHGYSSAVEEVYSLIVRTYKFAETPEILTYLASGIVCDTNNFSFLKSSFSQTFEYAAYLAEHGIDFAEVNRAQNKYDQNHIHILEEFLHNLVILDGITYSFISDAFYSAHPEIHRDRYTEAKEIFTLHFLRNVSENEITFALYPESNGYKGSLRGIKNTYDMTAFAKHLNGGGHKSASGFKLTEQKSAQEAVEKVLSVIREFKDSAKQ